MAASIILSSSFLPSQLSNSSRVHFKPYCTPTFKRTSFATKIRASSTAFAETRPTGPVTVEKDVRTSKNILACPVCYEPVTLMGATVLSVDSARGSSMQCSTCKKTYSGKETHLELTVASGSKEYGDAMPLATEFFRNLILVRADIAGLPFISGSLDAVHAGAAIHCWPSPSVAVAEVSRVLRPGGVFVATTYILDGHFGLIPFFKPTSQRFTQVSGSSIILSERELEDVCRACGQLILHVQEMGGL